MRKFRILMSLLIVLVAGFTLAACGDEKQASSEVEDSEFTDTLNEELRDKIGYPQVEDSLELRNLKRRYELLDDAEKIGWIYLIDHGLIFAEYQVQGKVSSMNSQFTNPRRLDCIKVELPDRDDPNSCGDIDQAEADGSFGENPEGIFFWTTDGVYVEWAGNYQYSDERLEIQQPAQNVLTQPVG